MAAALLPLKAEGSSIYALACQATTLSPQTLYQKCIVMLFGVSADREEIQARHLQCEVKATKLRGNVDVSNSVWLLRRGWSNVSNGDESRSV